MNAFAKLLEKSRMTHKRFSESFEIPLDRIFAWESGKESCPEYLLKLIEYKLDHEMHIYTINRNKKDFKKLFDYLRANEPIDKQLKDAAEMFFFPSIIIEELTK